MCSITKIDRLWSDCYAPMFHIGSPSARKIQTALSLVLINYRLEPRFDSNSLPRTEIKKPPQRDGFLFLVALVGIEPTLLSELDFESSASTSSTTEPEPLQLSYFAFFTAAFLDSTFFTNLALRVGLCAGFFAGFSALPFFFSMAFLIAAISGVKRDTGFVIT